MKSIFDGFLKWIILLLALGAGFVFVLKTFLNPPKASVPLTSNPAPSQPTSPPIEKNNPSNPVESATESSNLENSEINQSQPSNNNSTAEPELIRNNQPETNNIPTNKQPEEFVLEIPSRLEEGAELKVYLNNDDSVNPNPVNYSPSQVIKTKNIVLKPEEEDNIFQESTGYFRISESGEYNFLIEHPDKHYFDEGRLVTKVDQKPLGNSRGGRIKLDEGWHRIDVFYNPQNYARKIDEEEISIKMGRPGEVAERIEIWREAGENTAQKPNNQQAQ